jgi:hypothetical protein
MTKRRRREKNPKRESNGIQDGYQRKMKEIFIAVKRRDATVTCFILIPACPLTRVTLKNVHRALVILTIKQTI